MEIKKIKEKLFSLNHLTSDDSFLLNIKNIKKKYKKNNKKI